MFLIKWRTRNRPAHWPFSRWLYGWRFVVRTGLSRYPTREAAEKQIAVWQQLFPFNTYYVEPVKG